MKIRIASLQLFLAYLLLTLASHLPANHSHAADKSSDAMWQSVVDGSSIIIMRHALAPGTGDPDNFELRQCDTQRNLSDTGRQQARDIGKNFRQHGLPESDIYSSQWCRCLETAREMNLGEVQELPALNSFFTQRELGPAQIQKLKQWAFDKTKNQTPDKPLVLVTHQVVITALTGVYPSSGDAVVFQMIDENKLEVIGTIDAK